MQLKVEILVYIICVLKNIILSKKQLNRVRLRKQRLRNVIYNFTKKKKRLGSPYEH